MGNACCHKGGAAVAVDSEAVGEAVDPTLKQEMQKLAATVSSLQSALAQLTQVNGSLQREQDALKVQVASSRGAGSLSIQDPGALPGGWQPEEGSSRPVRHQNSHNGRGGEGGSAQATAASVARLEAQVQELTARVKAAESQIAGLTTMKEQWEAHRAAQEFAKQIKKLEEVGIPTNFGAHHGAPPGYGKNSGPPSSTSMSFADELPPLDGLPQGRYPRAQPSMQRQGSRRRDGTGTSSSGNSHDRHGAHGSKPPHVPGAAAARATRALAPIASINNSIGTGQSNNSLGYGMQPPPIDPSLQQALPGPSFGQGVGGGGMRAGSGSGRHQSPMRLAGAALPGSAMSGMSQSPPMGGGGGALLMDTFKDLMPGNQPGGNGGGQGGNGNGGAMGMELNSTKLYSNIAPSDHALAEHMRRNNTSGSMLNRSGPKQAF